MDTTENQSLFEKLLGEACWLGLHWRL